MPNIHKDRLQAGQENPGDVFFASSVPQGGAKWVRTPSMVAQKKKKRRITEQKRQLFTRGTRDFAAVALPEAARMLLCHDRAGRRRFGALQTTVIALAMPFGKPATGFGGKAQRSAC